MEWFYLEAGRAVGPVSEEQMVELIAARRVTPATLVKHAGLEDWIPLEKASAQAPDQVESATVARRTKVVSRTVTTIFILMSLLLIRWPSGALSGVVSILSHPFSPIMIVIALMTIYPVILFFSWWRSRRALKAHKLRAACLWALPPVLVMLPLFWVLGQSISFLLSEAYNTRVSLQGRFIEAIMNKQPSEVIAEFIKKGADVNAIGPAMRHWVIGCPLSAAMMHNRTPAVISLLLKAGADPNGDPANGNIAPRALSLAVSGPDSAVDTNTPAIVSLLLAAGADPDRQAPLCEAIGNNAVVDVVKMLLDAGAGLETKDAWGRTPLMMAAWHNKHLDVMEYLLGKGANVNAIDQNGATVLVWGSARADGVKFLELLLAHGADINARGKGGNTVLMSAARRNPDPEVVNMLIRHGSLVNSRDDDGMTALIYAASKNNYQVCAALVAQGADPAISDNSGKKALDYVSTSNKAELKTYTELLRGRSAPDDIQQLKKK